LSNAAVDEYKEDNEKQREVISNLKEQINQMNVHIENLSGKLKYTESKQQVQK